MLISIIIPVYNEENYIKAILEKINKIKINKQIVIVDDGSKDRTLKILKENCVGLFDTLIENQKNMGKGYAVRKGIEFTKGEIILIQDADLEYDPKNYPPLLEPIKNNKAKVVYGSRVLPGGFRKRPSTIDSKIRVFANYLLTKLSNLLNNQNLTDAHTCYKVFSAEILKQIELRENGFTFCPEVTAKVSKMRIKIQEVPIDYFGRTHDEGKKIKFSDGFKAIYAIFKYNLFD